MTIDEYVKRIQQRLDGEVSDALDPERLMTILAARITDNYGETNRNPTYPRNPAGNTLQLVKGSLFRAATVYRAKGNKSGFEKKANGQYKFIWGIDLGVIPYARIHELGGTIEHPGGTPYRVINGNAVWISKANGAGLKTTKPHDIVMPARPYIGPSIATFNAIDFKEIVEELERRLMS